MPEMKWTETVNGEWKCEGEGVRAFVRRTPSPSIENREFQAEIRIGGIDGTLLMLCGCATAYEARMMAEQEIANHIPTDA